MLSPVDIKHFGIRSYNLEYFFYLGAIFLLFWNILFGSRTICISGTFLTPTNLCDNMTVVARAMSRRPRRRSRQALRLRAPGPWRARHGRMDHTITLAFSVERVQLGTRRRTWRKKYDSIHLYRIPSFTHTDWLVLNCDYPTCSDGKKQHMGLMVHLYITLDDISTYHYLKDVLDGQSSAQPRNCFYATMGRY